MKLTQIKQYIDFSLDSTNVYVTFIKGSAIKLKMTSVYRLWSNVTT